MSSEPAPLQWSADGHWWWTGEAWVPAHEAPSSPMASAAVLMAPTQFPRASRAVFAGRARTAAIAAGVVALLVIGGVVGRALPSSSPTRVVNTAGVTPHTATEAVVPDASPAPEQHTINGSVVVVDFSSVATDGIATANGFQVGAYDRVTSTTARLNFLKSITEGGRTYDCSGGLGSGYNDLAAGGNVTIADGQGQIVGTAALQGGTLDAKGCTLTWTADVPDVPFYAITVGHRGALTYSAADLEGRSWTVASKIGG